LVFQIKPQIAEVPPVPSGSPLKSALISFRHYEERGRYPPPSASRAGSPIPKLGAAARDLGHVTMLADDDGTTRWEALVFEYRGYYYPSLALPAVRMAEGEEVDKRTLHCGGDLALAATGLPVN